MDMFKRLFLGAVGMPKRMNQVEQRGVGKCTHLMFRDIGVNLLLFMTGEGSPLYVLNECSAAEPN